MRGRRSNAFGAARTKGIPAEVAGGASALEHGVGAELAIVHLVLKGTDSKEDLEKADTGHLHIICTVISPAIQGHKATHTHSCCKSPVYRAVHSCPCARARRWTHNHTQTHTNHCISAQLSGNRQERVAARLCRAHDIKAMIGSRISMLSLSGQATRLAR